MKEKYKSGGLAGSKERSIRWGSRSSMGRDKFLGAKLGGTVVIGGLPPGVETWPVHKLLWAIMLLSSSSVGCTANMTNIDAVYKVERSVLYMSVCWARG